MRTYFSFQFLSFLWMNECFDWEKWMAYGLPFILPFIFAAINSKCFRNNKNDSQTFSSHLHRQWMNYKGKKAFSAFDTYDGYIIRFYFTNKLQLNHMALIFGADFSFFFLREDEHWSVVLKQLMVMCRHQKLDHW